jgi:hypothetical protein
VSRRNGSGAGRRSQRIRNQDDLYTSLLRRVLFVVVALGLLGIAWSGVSAGVNQWNESRTTGQVAQTLTQFAFALFALQSLVTMFRGRRWSRVMGVGLAVSLGLAGGLASVVWGGTSVPIGIIAALASAAVGLLMMWLARVATPPHHGPS